MRASDRPSVGVASSNQGILGQRLRREQIATPKTLGALLDTAVSQATNRQQVVYDFATGKFINFDPADIPWGSASPSTVGFSNAYAPKNTLNVTGFSVTIGVQGSSSTTVKLWKNGTGGTLIATVTVGASTTYGRANVSPSVTIAGQSDFLLVQITVIGTGADQVGGGIELG